MKASELMIGDWICSSINDINVRIAPADLNWDNAHTEWLANSKPIPLTEEIVIKNGLNEPEFFKGYWLMANKEGGFFIEDHVTMIFRYVHELQHALKLCGINKDIEL